MKLENERLSVEISEVGAEVTRIFPALLEETFPGTVPERGKDLPQCHADRRYALSDFPAWFCQRQPVQVHL